MNLATQNYLLNPSPAAVSDKDSLLAEIQESIEEEGERFADREQFQDDLAYIEGFIAEYDDYLPI